MKLTAKAGFSAVPAALVLRYKGGLRLAQAKRVVDELSEGRAVSISLRPSSELLAALRDCSVAVKEEREAARA
jgi:hypothetical protein